MATQIPCPHCKTLLALSEAYYGKQVRCRQCSQVFRADPPAPAPTPVEAPSVPPKPLASPVATPRAAPTRMPHPDSSPRPSERPPKEAPTRSRQKKMIVVLLLVGVILGCGGITFTAYRRIVRTMERIRNIQQEQENVPTLDVQREAPPAASSDSVTQQERLARLKQREFVRPPRSTARAGQWDVVSFPGEYVGAGRTYRYQPHEFTVRVRNGALRVEGSGWLLELAAEPGRELGVGVYRNAVRFGNQRDQAGLSFTGNGRGCNQISGAFVLWEWEIQGDEVVRVALDFVQQCDNNEHPLCGHLRLNSSYAP